MHFSFSSFLHLPLHPFIACSLLHRSFMDTRCPSRLLVSSRVVLRITSLLRSFRPFIHLYTRLFLHMRRSEWILGSRQSVSLWPPVRSLMISSIRPTFSSSFHARHSVWRSIAFSFCQFLWFVPPFVTVHVVSSSDGRPASNCCNNSDEPKYFLASDLSLGSKIIWR